MKTIVTLCDLCKEEYAAIFSLKLISGQTTTEKKTVCERCKKKLPADCLRQYLVFAKGRTMHL